MLQDFAAARVRLQRSAPDDITTLQGVSAQPLRWPTLFDALRAAQGVTPYSNLGAVQVVRKQPLSAGGGKRTTVQKNLDGNQTLEPPPEFGIAATVKPIDQTRCSETS